MKNPFKEDVSVTNKENILHEVDLAEEMSPTPSNFLKKGLQPTKKQRKSPSTKSPKNPRIPSKSPKNPKQSPKMPKQSPKNPKYGQGGARSPHTVRDMSESVATVNANKECKIYSNRGSKASLRLRSLQRSQNILMQKKSNMASGAGEFKKDDNLNRVVHENAFKDIFPSILDFQKQVNGNLVGAGLAPDELKLRTFSSREELFDNIQSSNLNFCIDEIKDKGKSKILKIRQNFKTLAAKAINNIEISGLSSLFSAKKLQKAQFFNFLTHFF